MPKSRLLRASAFVQLGKKIDCDSDVACGWLSFCDDKNHQDLNWTQFQNSIPSSFFISVITCITDFSFEQRKHFRSNFFQSPIFFYNVFLLKEITSVKADYFVI